MPAWNEILTEVENYRGNIPGVDEVRRKYINEFSKLRNRNVIVYYSDFLHDGKTNNISINDDDMSGFMTVVKGMNKSKGLDLIIHTPGGNGEAAEGIVDYLHSLFGNNIEIFVPHLCMSAGTMIACSAKTVWMGSESSLGPVDSQYKNFISVFNIKKEFETAKEELKNDPNSFGYWQIILSKYPEAMYYICQDAIERCSLITKKWLEQYMFADDENAKTKAEKIVKIINANNKSHGKHFNVNDCSNMGFKIKRLEDDKQIQDLVLSIYHACNITGSQTCVTKIIENQNGAAYICIQNIQTKAK